MIIVYTGNGKGKTCACIGQAMRALGQGIPVGFAQFMKRADVAGEQKILAGLESPSFSFRAGGLGFLHLEAEKPAHRQRALELLDWIKSLERPMLVMDEAIYALDYGLLRKEELLPFMDRGGDHTSHLVLSGRNAPEWLKRRADIVTEMKESRHAYSLGVGAIKGIEY